MNYISGYNKATVSFKKPDNTLLLLTIKGKMKTRKTKVAYVPI